VVVRGEGSYNRPHGGKVNSLSGEGARSLMSKRKKRDPKALTGENRAYSIWQSRFRRKPTPSAALLVKCATGPEKESLRKFCEGRKKGEKERK